MKVCEVIDLYKPVAVTLKSHAWKTWCKQFNERWGERDITTIGREAVNTLVAELRAAKKSEATVQSQLNTLRQLFYVAADHGTTCSYPSRAASAKVTKGAVRSLERHEEPKLKAFLLPADYDICVLFIESGIRGKELFEMEKHEVDLAAGFLYIRVGKNGEDHWVPISKRLRPVLRRMLAKGGRYLVNPDGFVSPDGSERWKSRSAMMESWKKQVLRPALRLAGIERFSAHKFRHTCATRKIKRGASLYQVQRWLGHSSPAMTQRYAHLAARDLKKIADW